MSREEPMRYRRTEGLKLSWIDDDPRRHLIERPDVGLKFSVGRRALALLENFGTGEEVRRVLAVLIPEEADREEEDRWLSAMDRIVGSGLLVADDPISSPGEAEPFAGLEGWNYHFRLITDGRRVGAYARAIRAAVEPGMTVVEIGTGTGILAAMAAGAGAFVYAVERADVIEMARRVVEEAGLSERIRLIRGDSRAVELEEKADLVLAEMVGNHILNEDLLELTLDARRRHAKPGAACLPRKLRVIAWPVTFPELPSYRRAVEATEAETGVGLRPFISWMEERLAGGGLVVEMDGGAPTCRRLGPGAAIADIDLETFSEPVLDVGAVLRIDRAGELAGVLLAFDLELWDGIRLDNRPENGPTHWHNPLYPIPEPFPVSPGSEIPIVARYRPGTDLDLVLASSAGRD